MNPETDTTGTRLTEVSNWGAYWKHLRIPFQLSLSPLFLWGFLLANGRPSDRLVFGFIALHFFLYSGITAFNSSFDRDTGPIGGMYAPPPVPAGLLAFSITILSAGAVICLLVNVTFLEIYLSITALGVAYSVPGIRLKSSPVASGLTVFVGQGALGFLAGWCITNSAVSVMTDRGFGGLFSAAFTALGLYPMTQIYQIEVDRVRGDHTIAVLLGPKRALWFGFFCLALAGAVATAVMARTSSQVDAEIIAIGYSGILCAIARFARLCRQELPNAALFWFSLRLNYVTSVGFLLFILLHFIRR